MQIHIRRPFWQRWLSATIIFVMLMGMGRFTPPLSVLSATQTLSMGGTMPGLVINKTAEDLNGAPLRPGDTIRYTLRVTNSSDSPMTGVRITDTLPFGVTFAAVVPAGYTGPNPLVWAVSGLPANAMWTGYITVTVDSGVSAIGGNVATVSSNQEGAQETPPVYPPGGGDVVIVPAPPVVTDPISGTVLNDATPVFSGTGEAGGAVTVYDEEDDVVCTATVAPDGTWTCTPDEPLAEGAQTIIVTITDDAGNESDPTFVDVIVDTIVPAPPVVTDPISGTVLNDATPVFSGTGEAGGAVTVYDEEDDVVCTATVAPDGTWTCTPDEPLAEGAQTITATVTDAAGNESDPTPVTFTVDTLVPAPPVIITPGNGTLTNDATPTFSGTGEAGGALNVYNAAGAVVCTITVAPDGTWTCTPGAPLAEGEQTVTATVTDAAGNESNPTPVTFTVDTGAPAAPVITTPINGTLTNDATPAFSGMGEAGGALTAFDAAGAVVCTATVAPDGTWTCTPDVPLAEGVQTITATVTDGAGNESDPTPVTFTVDTLVPAPPVITTPGNGALTNDATPAFSGMGEAGGALTVYNAAGAVVCTATVAPDGTWTCTPGAPLAEGIQIVTATITDAAGNESASASVIFTVDTVAPAAPVITTPINGTLTNDATPAFSGMGEAGGALTAFDAAGAVVCTATVAPDGTWTCTPDVPLAEGVQTITATVTDGAGNESDPTPVTFTVDTLVPAPPVITTPGNGALTNDATPAFSGMGEAGGALTVYNAAGAVVCTATVAPDGTWTCTPGAPLAEGVQTVAATVTDAAGNESDPTPVIFTVDSLAPAAPIITTPISGTVTNNPMPTFSGMGEAEGALTLYDEAGTVVCATMVASDGTWMCTPAYLLMDGERTFIATVTDAAGNESAPTPVFIIVDTLGGNTLNEPPQAVADEFVVPESVPEQPFSTLDVLANDGDPDGDAITITQVTAPGHGVVATDGATIVYTPTANYLGVDTFTYTITDGEFEDTAHVTITVSPVADLAVSQDISASIGGYKITLVAQNLGPRPAPGAVVSDTFPVEMGAAVWTCDASGGAACPNVSGVGALEETLGIFPAGGVLTYTIFTSGGTNKIVWNTVTITPPANMFDLAMGNNSAARPTIYRILLLIVYKNYTP